MAIDQNLVNQVAGMLTDDPDIVLEFEKQPGYPEPPPPPRKKSRHPLPKPVYPGSPQDQANKAREAKNADQKAREKQGRNRNPFGDSLLHDLDTLITG